MPRSLSSVCTNLASSQQCYNTCVSTETIFFSAQHISTNDHENTANMGFGITNKFSYIGKFTNTEFMNNEVRLYTHTHTHLYVYFICTNSYFQIAYIELFLKHEHFWTSLTDTFTSEMEHILSIAHQFHPWKGQWNAYSIILSSHWDQKGRIWDS